MAARQFSLENRARTLWSPWIRRLGLESIHQSVASLALLSKELTFIQCNPKSETTLAYLDVSLHIANGIAHIAALQLRLTMELFVELAMLLNDLVA